MPGIRAINERSTRTSSERGTSSNRRELYFRDGDQAFLIPVATGEDNDPYLDEFWMYTFQDLTQTTMIVGKQLLVLQERQCIRKKLMISELSLCLWVAVTLCGTSW